MTPELAASRTSAALHLERVKELIEEAENLPVNEQEAFVRSRADDDEGLIREVLSLLSLKESPSPWAEGPLIGRYEPVEPGVRIGRYKVESLLGTGGMGTVALAVREDDFTKKVALKIAHHRLSGEWARRFEAERQFLAQLEHPHVARILDGGTASDGRPFFAMEWVDGEPITDFCRRHDLGIPERLRLVIDICSALEVAHRNLIVHRDIKPSNILVTADGIAKLLDFGIAKQLGEDGELTKLAGGPMTLRYGSPEQIDGKPITTATDVHGIGLLLFELLTDQHPWQVEGQTEFTLADAIREEDAPRPSQITESEEDQRALRGDLDAIIEKALRKEAEDRYGSIGQLAEDLRRHLEGEPVFARDATWAYLSRRFIARHRVVLGLASALMLTMLILGTTSTILWLRATKAQGQTEVALEQARSERISKDGALEFMRELLSEAGPAENSEAYEEAAMLLVIQAEETLDDEVPEVQAEILSAIAQVYDERGLLDRAGNAWKRAEDVIQNNLLDNKSILAKAINNRALLAYRAGDYEGAVEGYKEALSIKQTFSYEDKIKYDYAKTLTNLANALKKIGQEEGLEEMHLEALALRRATDPPDPGSIARSLRSLAVLYHQEGRLDEAEDFMAQALIQYREADEPRRVASTLAGLGRIAHDKDQLDKAAAFYQQALELREKIFKGKAHSHVISSRLDMVRILLDRAKYEEASPLLGKIEPWLEEQEPQRFRTYRIRYTSLKGQWLLHKGDEIEADSLLESACEMAKEEKHFGPHERRACARLEARLSG